MNPNVISMYKTQASCDLVQAVVKAVGKEHIVIDISEGIVNATKAFSCIVEPCVDDVVLVNRSSDIFHVLSILERPQVDKMNLNFPGDVKLTSASGKIELLAADGINIVSAADASITSKTLNMTTADLRLHANTLKTTINDIDVFSKNIKINTKVLDMVAKQISQKTDVLVRWVEGVETLSIGNLIQNVRQSLTSHSNQAVITAKKDMRIDAERIHMG